MCSKKINSSSIIVKSDVERLDLKRLNDDTLDNSFESIMLKILNDIDKKFGMNHTRDVMGKTNPVAHRYVDVDQEILRKIGQIIDEENVALVFIELWNIFIDINNGENFNTYEEQDNNIQYDKELEKILNFDDNCIMREKPTINCLPFYRSFATDSIDIMYRTAIFEKYKIINDRFADLFSLFRQNNNNHNIVDF